MRELLPKEYEILDIYCDILPADDLSPVYPFTGFVVNFNVTTSIHRDWKDFSLCCVLAISDDDCEGGELCFEELGLVMKLKSGDMVLFASSRLSHFNMPYQGERCSIVFHSDSGLDGWAYKNRNGWGNSRFLNVSVSSDQDSQLSNHKHGRKGGVS
ncbi:hypothetical protein CVT26_011613 [Gymnopilus dilepis]|uniref:Fe2OG dioxygenase domain-containing protein n=1 Tax=Gymnopilus dilepis TaxID=231916 RepID=A0A409YQM6_9AGAR|nr:hypothetical protein CVT26_011613 [Gymnopilus dilepis]